MQNPTKNKTKQETKGIDFTIPPFLRFLYYSASLSSLYTEPTNDCTACLYFKLGCYEENSLPKVNKASFKNTFKKLVRLL